MIFIYSKNLYITQFQYNNQSFKEEINTNFFKNNSISFIESNNIPIEFTNNQNSPILELEFPDFPEE